MEVLVIVLVLVKLDAETPAAFPGFFVGGAGGGIGEGALAVRGGEVGEGVAEGPAFVEGGFEGVDFVVWVRGWVREAVFGGVVVFDGFVCFWDVWTGLARSFVGRGGRPTVETVCAA